MEGRYEGSNIGQTAEKGLYSSAYDDILERRLSESYSAGAPKKAAAEIRGKRRKHVLSRDAVSYYRRRLLLLLAAAVIVTFIFGTIGVHADPKGVTCSEDEFIYKVITVERGDTLWDIAETWSGSTDDDIRTYIDNICEMNHIHGDNLKEGQLLLIYYGESMAEYGMELAGK